MENLDKASTILFFPACDSGGLARPGRAFYKALDYTPFSTTLLVSFAPRVSGIRPSGKRRSNARQPLVSQVANY